MLIHTDVNQENIDYLVFIWKIVTSLDVHIISYKISFEIQSNFFINIKADFSSVVRSIECTRQISENFFWGKKAFDVKLVYIGGYR